MTTMLLLSLLMTALVIVLDYVSVMRLKTRVEQREQVLEGAPKESL